MNVDNLIFSSSSFSKPSLNIRKFLVRIMLKPSMQDFKHDLTSMGGECNSLMVSTFFGIPFLAASPVAQRLKRLSGMRETRVWSLGQEDPLEKEMATHSSTLAWKIPRTEDPGRLQFMGLQRVGHDSVTSLSFLC